MEINVFIHHFSNIRTNQVPWAKSREEEEVRVGGKKIKGDEREFGEI